MFATRLKLEAPLCSHFPKLPCVSMFLSSPWSFGDGGEKKEAKAGGEKMNLGLGGENFGAEKRAEKILGKGREK
jgi:hypothetical protein